MTFEIHAKNHREGPKLNHRELSLNSRTGKLYFSKDINKLFRKFEYCVVYLDKKNHVMKLVPSKDDTQGYKIQKNKNGKINGVYLLTIIKENKIESGNYPVKYTEDSLIFEWRTEEAV